MRFVSAHASLPSRNRRRYSCIAAIRRLTRGAVTRTQNRPQSPHITIPRYFNPGAQSDRSEYRRKPPVVREYLSAVFLSSQLANSRTLECHYDRRSGDYYRKLRLVSSRKLLYHQRGRICTRWTTLGAYFSTRPNLETSRRVTGSPIRHYHRVDWIPTVLCRWCRDVSFLDFLYSRTRLNDRDDEESLRLRKEGWEFISPCGLEVNYLQPDSSVVVYQSLVDGESFVLTSVSVL